MNDWWNNPPEEPESPMCCEEYMEVLPDGACVCLKCSKRIDPEPPEAIKPDEWEEVPVSYLRDEKQEGKQ